MLGIDRNMHRIDQHAEMPIPGDAHSRRNGDGKRQEKADKEVPPGEQSLRQQPPAAKLGDETLGYGRGAAKEHVGDEPGRPRSLPECQDDHETDRAQDGAFIALVKAGKPLASRPLNGQRTGKSLIDLSFHGYTSFPRVWRGRSVGPPTRCDRKEPEIRGCASGRAFEDVRNQGVRARRCGQDVGPL